MYQGIGQFGCGSVYFDSSLRRNREKEKEDKEEIVDAQHVCIMV
jgi:hypothetical protein